MWSFCSSKMALVCGVVLVCSGMLLVYSRVFLLWFRCVSLLVVPPNSFVRAPAAMIRGSCVVRHGSSAFWCGSSAPQRVSIVILVSSATCCHPASLGRSFRCHCSRLVCPAFRAVEVLSVVVLMCSSALVSDSV